MKRIAVVPAYEPGNRMIELLLELKNNDYIVIVVNDGSDFSYDYIFEDAKKYAKVLKHDINMGKGAALKTAFTYIKDNYNNYVVVTIDCDFQHLVSDANKLCSYIEDNVNDLVIGKRTRNSSVPLRSIIGNTITRFIFKIISKKDIYDTQSGLRAFSNNLIDYMLNISGNRFEYEMNMLLYAKDEQINIKEISISTIYFDNNKGSHFKTIRDSYRIYKQIFKFSFSFIFSCFLMYLFFTFFCILFDNIYVLNLFSFIVCFLSYFCLREFNGNLGKYVIKYLVFIIFDMLLLFLLNNLIFVNAFLLKLLSDIIILTFYLIYMKVFK